MPPGRPLAKVEVEGLRVYRAMRLPVADKDPGPTDAQRQFSAADSAGRVCREMPRCRSPKCREKASLSSILDADESAATETSAATHSKEKPKKAWPSLPQLLPSPSCTTAPGSGSTMGGEEPEEVAPRREAAEEQRCSTDTETRSSETDASDITDGGVVVRRAKLVPSTTSPARPAEAGGSSREAIGPAQLAADAPSSEETVGLSVSPMEPPSPAAPPNQAPQAALSARICGATACRSPPDHPPRSTGAPAKRHGQQRAKASEPAGNDPTKCEDCHKRVRTWAMPGETEKRWCNKCVQENRHPGAVRPTPNPVQKYAHLLCEDCKQKYAHYGESTSKKRRWCKSCVEVNGHTSAVCLTRNKMCEDCGQKQANFGRESEMTKRWCSACVKANGHTAVNVCGHKKCEICIVKFASYGTPTEGKRRWCGDCCKREPALSALGSAQAAYINATTCKDCGKSGPRYGDPTTRKRAWCAKCANANHPDAISVVRPSTVEASTDGSRGAYARKKCEACTVKIATHGSADEQNRRFCGSCAKVQPLPPGHRPLVNLNRSMCQDCNEQQAKYADLASSPTQKKRKLWCGKCVVRHPEGPLHRWHLAARQDLAAIRERFDRRGGDYSHDEDRRHPPDQVEDSPASPGLPTLPDEDLPNDDDDDDGDISNGGGDGISCSESLSVRLSQSIAAPRHQPRARAPESPSSSLASPTLASQAHPQSASGIDGSAHDHFSPVSAWPQAAECGWR